MNFFGIEDAFKAMRRGEKVARIGWLTQSERPSFVALVRGREITVSYDPMATHLGVGRTIAVQEHVDAVYRVNSPDPYIVVGYQFTREDVWSSDWFVATGAET